MFVWCSFTLTCSTYHYFYYYCHSRCCTFLTLKLAEKIWKIFLFNNGCHIQNRFERIDAESVNLAHGGRETWKTIDWIGVLICIWIIWYWITFFKTKFTENWKCSNQIVMRSINQYYIIMSRNFVDFFSSLWLLFFPCFFPWLFFLYFHFFSLETRVDFEFFIPLILIFFFFWL